MSPSNLLFAGIPHTGKTTYLALLALGITSQRFTTVQLGSYQDDREYLNSLAQRLFDCEEADHTEVGQSNGMGLSVKLPAGTETVLSIPDISGEVWQDLLVDRSWDQILEQHVAEAAGICIFVHVDEFTMDPTIAEVERAATALGEVSGDVSDNPNSEFASPGLETGQIQLVDLLQIVGEQFGAEGRRIALVLSAFDTVSGESPREWLTSNAPLVDQYLDANADRDQIEVFGLSAQGGRFDEKKTRTALLKKNPLERAFVMRGDGAKADLDAPVLWALNGG